MACRHSGNPRHCSSSAQGSSLRWQVVRRAGLLKALHSCCCGAECLVHLGHQGARIPRWWHQTRTGSHPGPGAPAALAPPRSVCCCPPASRRPPCPACTSQAARCSATATFCWALSWTHKACTCRTSRSDTRRHHSTQATPVCHQGKRASLHAGGAGGPVKRAGAECTCAGRAGCPGCSSRLR